MQASVIRKFYLANQNEITNDWHLQIYGALLAGLHLVTAYFYVDFNFPFNIICWPFLSGCQRWTATLTENWNGILIFYAILALTCLILFLKRRTASAIFLLLFLSLAKFLLQMTDYRLMGNYHYMFHIISFVFLFLPNKKYFIKLFIVGFYLTAGFLKFNSDWLSGELIANRFVKNQTLLELASAYAIVIELFFSLFLLSNKRVWFFLALAQLILFHLFSWPVVGYYYPVIMLILLSIFYMKPADFIWPRPSWPWIFVAFYLVAQLPSFIFSAQPAVSGEGRLFSLNMLDAKTECQTLFYIYKKSETIEYNPNFDVAGPRIHCDPVVVISKAAQTCQFYSQDPDLISIRVDHQARRLTDPFKIFRISFDDVCRHPLNIGILGHVYQ